MKPAFPFITRLPWPAKFSCIVGPGTATGKMPQSQLSIFKVLMLAMLLLNTIISSAAMPCIMVTGNLDDIPDTDQQHSIQQKQAELPSPLIDARPSSDGSSDGCQQHLSPVASSALVSSALVSSALNSNTEINPAIDQTTMPCCPADTEYNNSKNASCQCNMNCNQPAVLTASGTMDKPFQATQKPNHYNAALLVAFPRPIFIPPIASRGSRT
ncbi:MAG: hypothetical protein KUG79_01585 [Pseudomonadales bacterium]|nr:hypothetical protein [Pseudomonadales bacterium]